MSEPEGWVLVPREPTPVMLGHGWVQLQMPSGGHTKIRDIYLAMLAAAPRATQSQEESK